MDGRVQIAGGIVCIVGFVMFISGAMTDCWVKNGDGDHWGLWIYCLNSSSHVHHEFMNSNTSNSDSKSSSQVRATFGETRAPRSTSPPPQQHLNETSEEEEECVFFGLSDLPVTFHIVRALMVIAAITVVYTGFSVKRRRLRYERKDSCISTHRVEIGCVLGGAFGIVAISLFKSSYKSHQFVFDDQQDRELDWSINSVQSGCILVFIGIIIFMAPMLKEKFVGSSQRSGSERCFPIVLIEDFVKDPYSFCCRWSRSAQNVPREGAQEVQAAHAVPEISILTHGRDSTTSSTSSIPNADLHLIMVGVGDSSPSLSRSSRHNYEDPAPRYEDLQPKEAQEMPPPPSYSEAITGQYSVSHLSNSVNDAPSLTLTTESEEFAPPGYDECRV